MSDEYEVGDQVVTAYGLGVILSIRPDGVAVVKYRGDRQQRHTVASLGEKDFPGDKPDGNPYGVTIGEFLDGAEDWEQT